MFKMIKAKLHDAGIIKTLCESAEAYALRDQQRQPGAEHFLLAALDLEDGTARLALEKAGAAPDDLANAIERQYTDALESIGLSVGSIGGAAPSAATHPRPGLYQASASGQDLMQVLATTRRHHAPLLGAHIVAIVAGMPHGIAARALRGMGVDLQVLRSAADEIIGERTIA